VRNQQTELARLLDQLVGGSLRWFCTLLALLAAGFALYLYLTNEPVEVFVPFHLKDRQVLFAIVLAAIVFGALGLINWLSWSKRRHRR
jgi:uncharacterized membrane protein YidH (DUF202 family)